MDGGVEDQGPTSSGSCISDCESSVSGPVHRMSQSHERPLMRLDENGHEQILLKHRLYSSLGSFSSRCHIAAVYKNTFSTEFSAAQLEAFRSLSECMARKRGGNPNIRLAWYGTSREGVGSIIRSGFSLPDETGPFGQGLYLSTENYAIDSLATSTADTYGLRHLLLCKVILGNTEQILPESKQSSPSTEEFDSGVDDQMCPKRYIIWKEWVKDHILPLYVISIKLERHMTVGVNLKGLPSVQHDDELQEKHHPASKSQPHDQQTHRIKKPTSPWIPLSTLVSMLSRSLSPNRVCMIKKFHIAYMERKITRQKLIHHIRELTGDRMLIVAIRAFQDKQVNAALVTALKRGQKNIGRY